MPFMNALTANYVPTLLDIDVIERTLAGSSSELKALKGRLQKLQEQLEMKREMGESLSRSIAKHQTLLDPFSCLPDEILSKIFLACLPTDHEALMDHNEPPLVLGYVCRRWFFVAYDTPRLWASLHIEIPAFPTFRRPVDADVMMGFNQNYEQRVWHHQIRILNWLRRSKACSLSISIHDHFPPIQSTAPAAKSYYELVYNFSDRVRCLDLNVLSHQSVSDLIATAPATSFPQLQDVFLKFHRRLQHIGVEKWKYSGLLNVPSLERLSITQCPLRMDEMDINWAHLTHITAAGCSVRKLDTSDAQKILVCCPRLQFCSIDISNAVNTYTPGIALSLPYLHTLSLVDKSTCLGDIFQYADLPALRDLTYHSKLCPTPDRRSALLVILSHTDRRLERLTTNIQFYTLADLLECFEMTPRLTHLTNTHCPSGSTSAQRQYCCDLPVARKMLSAILRLLTPTSTDRGAVLLPNLQVVTLNLHGLNLRVTDGELLHFVRSRMAFSNASPMAGGGSEGQIAALRKVSFTSDVMEIELRAELAEYIADGLKLELAYVRFPSVPPVP